MFNFSDNLFNRIEKKTNVGKETILNLANKLQQADLKDEKTLREVIQELSSINAVKNNNVPKDIDKMF